MVNKVTVLDSNNLEAIIADATGEKPEEKLEEKLLEVKPEEETDDIEGEDGLTPRQKRELTQKMQAAVGKKHRALKEAEEFAAEQYNEKRLAEQRAENLQRELERLKTQAEPPKETPKEPKRENFKTDEEYQDARIDWKADLKYQEKEAERQKALEAERQAQIAALAAERITKARELVPDFDEVVSEVDTPVPPYIAGYMQESEMFAELGYHFAKHPEELKRVASLNPARALVEVGKIESRLTPFSVGDGTKAEKETKTNGDKPKPSTETGSVPSKPRAPITPLSSASAVQVEKSPHERTYEEEKAAWAKRNKANFDKRQRH